MTRWVFLAVSFLTAFWIAGAQDVAQPVKMVVTVEAHHKKDVPTMQAEDITIVQNKDRQRATGLAALQGDQAALELYLLIDDGADPSLGSQLGDLRKFISGQPVTTRIGVGYMRNGTANLVQEMTADHDRAAKALRLPLGSYGVSGSPYLSLSELVKKWPESASRREILLVTSGIDLYYGPGSQNPYLETAIRDCQRAGVVVFSIYFGEDGHLGHNSWRINWAQNYLSQLSEETGGEAYWQGFGNPVSFAPFLEDLSRKLNQQYLLTFYTKPAKKAELMPVKLRTELEHVDLLYSGKVWVPAGR